MNFDRYFIASSYSLLITGFSMLVATRRIDSLSVALFVGALTVSCLIDSGQFRWAVSRQWANGLTIAWLVVAFIEWQIFGSSPILVVTHFVLFATAIKLLRQKNNRDWLWLYIVSFCIVLMSAGLMIGTVFLFLLIVYLLTAISAFISFEIHRSRLAFEESTDNQPVTIELWREGQDQRRRISSLPGFNLIGFSSLTMILILLTAAPLFFLVPRISHGMGRSSLLSNESYSGFSDSVRLGDVAQVKLNPQVVMRVRVKHSSSRERQMLRWRGVTLDRYDGQSWNNTGPEPSPLRRTGESFRIDENQWPRTFTEQQFFLEPLNIPNVFAAPRPLLIIGLPELSRDGGDGLWMGPRAFNDLNYTVYSDTTRPSNEELAEDNSRDFPRNITQRYLQLPPGHDQRITKLANEITLNAATEFDIAHRIEQHLREEYNYTLDLHPVESGDPVADFLFNTHEGHCEYFASAMVLMLRSKRIPARLVNGFQMGEYNPTVDFYTVRQSDAHSWVEVYFPQSKWIAFDPTPPAGLSVYGDGMLAWMRQYSEAMEMMWMEHVLGFDTSKQLSMMMAARDWIAFYQNSASWRWMEWTSDLAARFEIWQEDHQRAGETGTGANELNGADWRKLPFHPLTIIFVGLAAIAGFAFIQRNRLRSWRRQINRNAQESAIRFYQEMLRQLERNGHTRQPNQTPQEFASQLAIPQVSEITRLYQQTRFGGQTLTDNQAAHIESLLRELKRQSQKSWLARLR